jgi:hypothetical protein
MKLVDALEIDLRGLVHRFERDAALVVDKLRMREAHAQKSEPTADVANRDAQLIAWGRAAGLREASAICKARWRPEWGVLTALDEKADEIEADIRSSAREGGERPLGSGYGVGEDVANRIVRDTLDMVEAHFRKWPENQHFRESAEVIRELAKRVLPESR